MSKEFGMLEHEWHSGGGPITREYEFPLELGEAVPEDSDPMASFIEEHGPTAEDCTRAVATRFEGISHPTTQRFLELFEGREPSSVVILEGDVWINMRPSSVAENQRSVLLPAWCSTLDPGQVHPFPINNFPDVIEFLEHFSGLTMEFPPFAGVRRVKSIFPVETDAESYAWLGLGDWEGSLPIYDDGTGDTLLLKDTGQTGMWFHEVALEKHEASDIAICNIGDDLIQGLLAEIHSWPSPKRT